MPELRGLLKKAVERFCSLVSYNMNKLPFLKGFGFLLLPLQLSAQFHQSLAEVVCEQTCPVILESVCVI